MEIWHSSMDSTQWASCFIWIYLNGILILQFWRRRQVVVVVRCCDIVKKNTILIWQNLRSIFYTFFWKWNTTLIGNIEIIKKNEFNLELKGFHLKLSIIMSFRVSYGIFFAQKNLPLYCFEYMNTTKNISPCCGCLYIQYLVDCFIVI